MKQRFSRIIGMLVIVAVAGLANPAFAADDNAKLDKYLDKYWGEKRQVKVIQKRLFQKDGRFTITPYVGTIPNDDFYLYFPIGVKAGYYFSEDLGVEIFGSYMPGGESDLGKFLRGDFVSAKVEFPQVLKWNAGIQGLWSPIHGKIGIFASKLFHYDIHLSFGVGAIGTEVSQKRGADVAPRTDVAGNIGAGARIFVTDWAAVTLDYRHFFYAAMEDIGGVSTPIELTLGFTWFVN